MSQIRVRVHKVKVAILKPIKRSLAATLKTIDSVDIQDKPKHGFTVVRHHARPDKNSPNTRGDHRLSDPAYIFRRYESDPPRRLRLYVTNPDLPSEEDLPLSCPQSLTCRSDSRANAVESITATVVTPSLAHSDRNRIMRRNENSVSQVAGDHTGQARVVPFRDDTGNANMENMTNEIPTFASDLINRTPEIAPITPAYIRPRFPSYHPAFYAPMSHSGNSSRTSHSKPIQAFDPAPEQVVRNDSNSHDTGPPILESSYRIPETLTIHPTAIQGPDIQTLDPSNPSNRMNHHNQGPVIHKPILHNHHTSSSKSQPQPSPKPTPNNEQSTNPPLTPPVYPSSPYPAPNLQAPGNACPTLPHIRPISSLTENMKEVLRYFDDRRIEGKALLAG